MTGKYVLRFWNTSIKISHDLPFRKFIGLGSVQK